MRKILKAAVFIASLGTLASSLFSQDLTQNAGHHEVRHVLLISIDGMHAVDPIDCSKGIREPQQGAPYRLTLASLEETGVNYMNASTSKPSDSFPGLTALVTGGSPRTTGIYYDVSYDRSLDPPMKTTGNGVAAGTCTANAAATGTRTEYEEGIDLDQTKLNGGAPGAGLTDGGISAMDPSRLIRDPKNNCAPVYPWDFVRTNSIFGVIHAAGGYAAWWDKHPADSSVAGHGGAGVLNDYYSPEINLLVVNLPGITTSDNFLRLDPGPELQPSGTASQWRPPHAGHHRGSERRRDLYGQH